MKQDYKAESIIVLKDLEAVRKNYNLNWLASKIREMRYKIGE
jgi:DNA gyrase/topoisomerase IV subunit B